MKVAKFKFVIVHFPDDTDWRVPLEIIARNRADHYKDEFDNDIERSLAEDTVPYFLENTWNAVDWIRNNMDWADVEKYAVKINKKIVPPNYHQLFPDTSFDFE